MGVDNRLDKLSESVDRLIALVQDLKQENSALKTRESELVSQTEQLKEKNHEARKRLDSIITKLRQGGEQI